MQSYDYLNEQEKQGMQYVPKQGNFFNQQPQYQIQQQQQQKQQQSSPTSHDKYNQFQYEIQQQQQQQQLMSPLQVQMQQQQLGSQQKADDQNKKNNSDEEDFDKQNQEFIRQILHELDKYFKKLKVSNRKPNEEEIQWVLEVSLNLSVLYQEMGNKCFKNKRYSDAEKWLMVSLQYTEPNAIDEPVYGPQGEKLNRREMNKLEWYLQRISIANSLHALFKKRKKLPKIIDTLKTILSECENCQHKIKLQEHIQSNLENLYYHIAEFHLIRMSTSSQSINQKQSQPYLGGFSTNNMNQQSLTNFTSQQQANLLSQKGELEETMRYAKQCLNILCLKYKNISTKKQGDVQLIDTISKVYLEKKQIMFIHVMYLIGRSLQWGEFYLESLQFYKQAYFIAKSHFKRRGIHPADGQDDLLLQYRQKIEQVTKILQNDIDENLSPEQFDKAFRDDLEILQVNNDDQNKQYLNNTKTLSLNFDVIQPILQTTDVQDMFEGFAPSHARLKSQGITDEDNLNFFTDETLVESQMMFDQAGCNKNNTEKTNNQKRSNRLSTKSGKSQGVMNQQKGLFVTLKKMSKNENILDRQKILGLQQTQQTRKTSLNLITKESIVQVINDNINKQIPPSSSLNQLFIPDKNQEPQSLYQRKHNRSKINKNMGITGYIDQENEITQHLLENRNLKRVQGQTAISELADTISMNYNNYVEYRKELNDFFPQLESHYRSDLSQYGIYQNEKKNIQIENKQILNNNNNNQALPSNQMIPNNQIMSNNFMQLVNQTMSTNLQGDFNSHLSSRSQYFNFESNKTKPATIKGIIQSIGNGGFTTPNQINMYLHQQQQQIQNNFSSVLLKKPYRVLTSNTQLSSYRPQSSNRNLQQSNTQDQKMFREDNVFDNVIEQIDDEQWTNEQNISEIHSNRNHQLANKDTPPSPTSQNNGMIKYELLVRPNEQKQNQSSRELKKPFQIKKVEYQIKINQKNNNIQANQSYNTIDEQFKDYSNYPHSGGQTPQRSSPVRQKSLSVTNQIKAVQQNQRPRSRPQTSNAYTAKGAQNKNNFDNLSRNDSYTHIGVQQEVTQGTKRSSLFPLYHKQNQPSNTEFKNTEETNTQKQQQNAIQKYKNCYEIFEDDNVLNFVQGFDLEKVINQKLERLTAEIDERNLKDRENSLQKLEYIGPENKNLTQNQPTLQNDDDLFSEDGDRDVGLQEDKQQLDIHNINKDDKANTDQAADRALTNESERFTKDKEEYFSYKQREVKRTDEIYSFFKKVKKCKDRFLAFYQKYNQSVACLWKLEKFKIKFKVFDPHKDVASLANFNFRNKESVYKFTLVLKIESMFYSGKLHFTIQKYDLDFLENLLYKTHIITRWGLADFILSEYFKLPRNTSLMNNWINFYNKQQQEDSQFLISLDGSVGSYQGQFEVLENIEMINVGIKIQFLVGQCLKLVKTPSGEKLKYIQPLGLSTKQTLNSIPQFQHEENDEAEQEQYLKNYLFLKEFLKVRRQIVRKTIVNLEMISPSIFIKLGCQKKFKQTLSNFQKDLIQRPEDQEKVKECPVPEDLFEKEYIDTQQYVMDYKQKYLENIILFERYLKNGEEYQNKNQQPSNSLNLQKQMMEIINSRQRQKSSAQNLPQAQSSNIGNFKPQQSIRGTFNTNQQLTQTQVIPNVNMASSINMAQSINPLTNSLRQQYQQGSIHSNSSLNEKHQRQASRNNSIIQMHELQVNRQSVEFDNLGEIVSPKEVNSSIDSSQSRFSLMKGNQNTSGIHSGNAVSIGRDDSRHSGYSKQESFRRERDMTKSENKNILDDDQNYNQQIPSGSSSGQNPNIERIIQNQRNMSKKSTFFIRNNNDDQNEKENSRDVSIKQQIESEQKNEYGDNQRNLSINLPQFLNQKESEDLLSISKQKTLKQLQPDLNDFKLTYSHQNMNDLGDKLSQSRDMSSIDYNYNRIAANEPVIFKYSKQEDIIEQFKYELNLSVSVGSGSESYDSQEDGKYQNDEEEQSVFGQFDKKFRSRHLTHTKSSMDSSQQMYPDQIQDTINQNIGSHDFRGFKQFDDKIASSDQMGSLSPKSYTDDNNADRDSKQFPQFQSLQQQQENSIDNTYQNNEYMGLEYDERMQDGSIGLMQIEYNSRQRDDSKNIWQVNNTDGFTNSTQYDFTVSQQIRPGNQGMMTIDDIIAQKVDLFNQILIRQVKIRFCKPPKYYKYYLFEENQNIAQIIVPNIFINVFRQKTLLLCGIMRFGSMSVAEYNRRKEGDEMRQAPQTNKADQYEEEEDEDFGQVYNKYQRQQQQIITDDSEKQFFFVTVQMSYTQNAKVQWDIEKLKKDVLIHVDAVQLVSEYSQDSVSKYSCTVSFYEFISSLFPEDNDLLIQEYYDNIQHLLKKAQGKNKNHDTSEEDSQYDYDDSILKEEDFGFNLETLQNEGLYPFQYFNISFQKKVCIHQFKLNKFIYNIGFNRSQKKTLLERMNNQMFIVDEQLRLLPRKIKRFRLLNDTLYFVDDNRFSTILQTIIEKQNQYQNQSSNVKKLLSPSNTLNLTNLNTQSLQIQINSNNFLIQKMKPTKNEQEEQKSEENQVEKNNDSFQDPTSNDKKKVAETSEKIQQQVSNIKLSPMNSQEFDENKMQKRHQQIIDQILHIIISEKIYHLHQIITRDSTPQAEYKSVLTKKQFEEKQSLYSQEALDGATEKENIRSQTRIASIAQNIDNSNQNRRESMLDKSLIKSPQNLFFNSSISKELSFAENKQRKSSIMAGFNAQKLTRKLKKAIKSEFNNIKSVTKDERERNYNDGRIHHSQAMTYYNSLLRIEPEDQNKKMQKQIQRRKREERKIIDNREPQRREEDLKIIESLQSHKDGFRKKIKVEYLIDQDGELYANISFYDPLSYKLEKVRVKEKKNLEKLQNLLQVNNSLLRNNQLRDILIKMNMKWSRKIIGRKLEFRSFIETNEDFFNYKLNRKKNPNDEALYKLMTAKNYLDESIKQFTNFLYKVKLALISNDQNAETAEQNYFFNTYFYSTRVQQFQKITNLGRALIQTTVYQSKLLYTADNYVFIRIDITPASKRTRLIKMILDYNDITTIFSKTKYTLKNCLDHEAITKMIIEFAEKVNYSHTQNYNALKIPFWKQFNQISESSDYDLVNQFDFNSMNTKQEISFLSKKSMLTPVLRTLKIIYQVITVKRYIYLNIDWFQLIIYIPKTSRRFICFLMESDMLKFDPDFMEQVIPLIIVKYESNINELKQSKNYLQFCEAFDQMHSRLVQQEAKDEFRRSDKKITFRSENWFMKSTEELSSTNNLKMKNKRTSLLSHSRQFDFHNHEYRNIINNNNHSLKSIESLNELRDSSINSSQFRLYNGPHSKYATQRTNFVKYFQKNLTEQTSFLEKKVWEHLISAIVIDENLQHKLVLKINTFSGILRETLSSMVLNMNERDNILYEFYIEEQKKKSLHSIFLESKPIKLEESFNSNLYELVHNQKVCGRHMLFSYHKMARSKLKNKIFEENNLQQKNSGSQQKISQTKIESGTKIPSFTKIQHIPLKQQANKFKRTSIMDKKGVSINLNPIPPQNIKKSVDYTSRLSHLSVQRTLADQAATDNPFFYSFILADMQEMAIFYANKIKANYNQFVKEREKKQLKGKIQDYLSLYKSKSLLKDGECEAILKPNKNFKRHKQIDPQQIKYFIIYRRILTISPRQMITIFYKPDKQTFYMYCWNNINSKEVIIKKRLSNVEKYIPHATQFLDSKLYKELGDRIYQCFKNQILLQTYNHLKLNSI